MRVKTFIQSPRPLILGGSILFLSTFYPLSSLAANGQPWSIKASTGIEYDSNISVQELDVTTRNGDSAALLDFSANYEAKVDDSTSFTVGYSFSQNLHKDATSFDLQSHIITAMAKHKFSGFDLGVDYLYINTSLGGNSFLQIHKATPYVSFFATPALFFRADYAYTDKNFKTNNDRDAKTNSIGASAFYFMNHSKSYLMLTYKYDSLNANADQFDYNGHDVKVRYQMKFPWSGREARFRIGGRYLKRNYDAITPSIGEIRDDKRTSFESALEIPFFDIWNAILKYRYTDATSNLPSADYKENLVTFEVGFEF